MRQGFTHCHGLDRSRTHPLVRGLGLTIFGVALGRGGALRNCAVSGCVDEPLAGGAR